MQEDKLYEYAVIRLVPQVEREEFINVGLILFSKKDRYIQLRYHLCKKKAALLCPQQDFDDINRSLRAWLEIAHGNKTFGPIANLEIAERFRWLTAVRSAMLQTSRPHPGKSPDLEATFEQLFQELVM